MVEVGKNLKVATNQNTGETIVLISRKFLSEYYFKISSNQMVSYSKANLYSPPLLPVDTLEYGFKSNAKWYDHLKALAWHSRYIVQKNSPKQNKYTGLQREDIVNNGKFKLGDKITPDNAKIATELGIAEEKVASALLKKIEIKIKKKEYIPAEFVDKSQKSFVSILLQGLTNKLISLPKKLEMKNSKEISEILEAEFKDTIYQIKNTLKKSLAFTKKRQKYED